eukprot:CAMPEP_0197399614 /NCGR_PEP_ID=MMETSP1165-20131217/15510_1 /TAXON_ID=284809 /ORGANISM="Chrysocystis fragilis, Strain CCMP3189" /LENGTH=162 /DNA_ID=CAMNT_0042925633 /DNA_START=32 /DNA_END=516 /DNA_ORIENTATION=+
MGPSHSGQARGGRPTKTASHVDSPIVKPSEFAIPYSDSIEAYEPSTSAKYPTVHASAHARVVHAACSTAMLGSSNSTSAATSSVEYSRLSTLHTAARALTSDGYVGLYLRTACGLSCCVTFASRKSQLKQSAVCVTIVVPSAVARFPMAVVVHPSRRRYADT